MSGMDPLPSPSPVRQRSQQQCLRSSAGATQPPWNTARCNRLLRPLSSKITCLRKSRQFEIQCGRDYGGSEQVSHGMQKQSGIYSPPNANLLSGANVVSQASKIAKTNDQEWVPSPVPPKKIKRTYSSKDGGHEVRRSRCKNQAPEPSPLHETIIQMPDPQNSFIHRQRQAFLRITGPENADELSVTGSRAQCSKNSRNAQGPSREIFCRHAKFVEPEHWKLINGLYNGLDTLLRATEKSGSGADLGARSLFSACLRKVPSYIAEEQLLSKTEDPESDIDMASHVYSDLEALNSSPSVGWKPLREVVRAHGIFMLGDAFKEGLLSPSLARGLIVTCLHYRAYDEAQHLVECIINSMKPLRKSQTIPKRPFARDCSVELSTLKFFVTASGRFHFLYRQLARMFTNGTLPLEWISSPGMVDCWNGVIWSTTQEDEHTRAAVGLLQTIVFMDYGGLCPERDDRVHDVRLLARGASRTSVCEIANSITPVSRTPQLSSDSESNELGKAPSSVISNVLTVLCAVGLLGPSTPTGSISPRVLNLTVMQDLALAAHRALAVKEYHAHSGRKTKPCADHIGLLFLATKLIEETVYMSGELLTRSRSVSVDIITRLGCSGSLPSGAASFLCAVARCCERATFAGAFDYLQSIVQQLQSVSTSETYASATRTLYSQIAMATAFEYSEETNQLKHLNWALDLEQIIAGTNVETIHRTPGKTPARKSLESKSGYRWEEGICEWVAKTPATLWSTPECVDRSSSFSSDSESDSSATIPSILPSKQRVSLLLPISPGSAGNKDIKPDTDSKTSKGPSHLTKYLQYRFQKPIGKICHVDNIAEIDDELSTIYRDSFPPHMGVDTEDELSTPNSSQEMPKTSRPKLRELTNIGASIGRKRAARWKQNGETRKRRALCHSTKLQMQRPNAGPLKVNESFKESSEDELSMLAY